MVVFSLSTTGAVTLSASLCRPLKNEGMYSDGMSAKSARPIKKVSISFIIITLWIL